MKFTPKTEREIAEAGLFQAGEFDFQISEAVEGFSKRGNEMITLIMRVYDDTGRSTIVRDYLLESIPRKLRNVCAATGLLGKYESGELDAHELVNRTGRCKIRIEKDESGAYPDRNSVQDYIASAAAPAPARPARAPAMAHSHSAARPDLDDEVPF